MRVLSTYNQDLNYLDVQRSTIHVLIIEDSAADYALAARVLRNGDLGKVETLQITSAPELQQALNRQAWDIVLSDFNLPGFGALAALEMVRALSQELPFILVSGAIGEESAVEVMKAGVEDIVMKSHLDRLVPAMKRALRESRGRIRESKSRQMAEEAILAREQMLAIVSHDIKNPLSSIQLNAQLLARVADDPHRTDIRREVRVQTQRILKGAERLKSMISDLLDQSTIEAGAFVLEKTSQDAGEILSEVLDIYQTLAAQKSILLIADASTRLPQVQMDRGRIFQVLSNLVANAIKFTPHRGTIQLGVEAKSDALLFSVKDNGPGLPLEYISHVFERYWKLSVRGAERGTGLGLYIAKKIVEAHGGTIGVDSKPNEGAKFWFTLPFRVDETRSTDAPSATAQDSVADFPANAKILFIEDDEDLKEVLESFLKGEGFEVQSYSRADRALEDWESGKASADLIIVDYRMPHMTGAQFLERKRSSEHQSLRDCPSILLTAERDIEEKARVLGVSHCVRKPPSYEQFIATVRDALRPKK